MRDCGGIDHNLIPDADNFGNSPNIRLGRGPLVGVVRHAYQRDAAALTSRLHSIARDDKVPMARISNSDDHVFVHRSQR